MHLLDDLPAGVSGGGDFITGMGARDVKVTTPGGGVDVRKERWVATDKTIAYWGEGGVELPPPPPGRVVFSESTVTAMGRLVGMVPEGEVLGLRNRVARLTAELEDVSEALAAQRRENEDLRESTDTRIVYVAPDGTEHASRLALAAHMEARV